MTRKQIPDEDCVARHCAPKDFVDEEKTELKEDVFRPTDDDPEVSVNWLGYYGDNLKDCIDKVCRDMSSERDVRRSHKLALIRAGKVKEIGKERGFNIDVLHDPLPNNDSHAVIANIPPTDRILHQELADTASESLTTAVAYKRRS